ncbi:unnamed protein product [Ambrosiozyma monospora]|uniref:Unnamed protein product n=1 Tax=Ambrosiozyma monospora TaxID=43982 RepID=A0ACB5SW38_AMBMO|nr:unnamed protein product [Ambrosiozyma monospora]
MKSLNETIAIDVSLDTTGNESFTSILKAYDYSIIRRSTEIEQLVHGTSQNKNGNSLIQLASSFSNTFSNETLSQIQFKLLNKSSIGDIFNEVIATHITEQTVTDLLTSLNSISGAFTEIQKLVDLSTTQLSPFRPVENTEFGSSGKTVLSATLRSQLYEFKSQLFNLILIFLTVDNNGDTLKLYEKLLSKFQKVVFCLKLIEIDDVLVEYLEKMYSGKGILVRFSNLSNVVTDAFGQIFKDYFLFYSLSELIHSNKSDRSIELADLFPLQDKNPLAMILKGLALLDLDSQKAFKLFVDSTDDVLNNLSIVDELDRVVVEGVSPEINFLLGPDLNKVKYYYNLGTIFQSHKLDRLSLQFMLKALSTKTELHDDSDDQLILSKIFSLSMKLNEFELAYDNILKMKNIADRRESIRFFIYKLFEANKISTLQDFQFNKDFDVVDGLIYELAEKETLENNDYLNGLRYYRINYSLRLREGDFRGAMEALYRYNTIITSKGLNDGELTQTVGDNYLIILNLMKTLDEDDQWIIKQKVTADGSNELVKVKSLETEAEIISK